MGGTDDPTNLVELTVSEHADAHRVLWETYGKQEDLLAWKSLSKQIDEEEIQELRSSIGGKNNKGKPKSEETKRKMSETKKKMISDGTLYLPKMDEVNKQKISKALKGNNNFKKSWSEERRKAFSERMKLSHKENPRVLERDENGKIKRTRSSAGQQQLPSKQ